MGFFKALGKMIDNYLDDETFKITRVQKHNGELELQGIWAEKRVFLYGQELTKDKICETFNWNPEDVYFSWGDMGAGSFYLSSAVLLEVYDKENVMKITENLQKDIFSRLSKEDFQENFPILVWHANLDKNKIRRKKLADEYGDPGESGGDDGGDD